MRIGRAFPLNWLSRYRPAKLPPTTVTGTASNTLDAVTASGAAAVAVAAAATPTLAAVTASGAAAVAVTAAATPTLADVTASGTASVLNGPAGVLTSTLDAVTAAGTATVAVAATTDATLAAVTLSGTATVVSGPSATLSTALDAVTAAGTATVAVIATGAGTIGPVTGSGTAIGGTPVVTAQAVGSPRRRKHYLEHEGQLYEIQSREHLRALLEHLRRKSPQVQEKIVKRALRKEAPLRKADEEVAQQLRMFTPPPVPQFPAMPMFESLYEQASDTDVLFLKALARRLQDEQDDEDDVEMMLL